MFNTSPSSNIKLVDSPLDKCGVTDKMVQYREESATQTKCDNWRSVFSFHQHEDVLALKKKKKKASDASNDQKFLKRLFPL